ncbi:unnamed protein product, partial [Didymodactylos carnosus]
IGYVFRIALLLQEYNIEQVIHIKGRHNCLPDYMSRNPVVDFDDLMDTDYGLEVKHPVSGLISVTTRARAKAQKLATTDQGDQSLTTPHATSLDRCYEIARRTR